MIDLDAIKARAAERTHTMETMPLEADIDALAAEVERLQAERQAVIDVGGDFLWAGGATTLPDAVSGLCRAYTVSLDRAARDRDKSPAAKARDDVAGFAGTDADLVRHAIERAGRGEYRRNRWLVVGEIFGVGGLTSMALCRATSLDPFGMVGDDGEGGE